MSAPWRRCEIEGCYVSEARPIEPGKIGVVTVTYNSRSVLEDYFSSLEKQTHADHALYIVDSGSTDDTVAYVQAHLPPMDFLKALLLVNPTFLSASFQPIERACLANSEIRPTGRGLFQTSVRRR